MDRAQPAPNLVGDPPAASSPQGLADRSALALVAVERTRMPMVVCDPRQGDSPIVRANQAFLALTGYDVLRRWRPPSIPSSWRSTTGPTTFWRWWRASSG